MDSSRDSEASTRPTPETGTENDTRPFTSLPRTSEIEAVPSPDIEEAVRPTSISPPLQSETALEPHPRAPTPPSTIEPAEEIEHAYWAEFEEDTTTPDEEELKEIDAADADYSARDRRFNIQAP